MGCQLSAIGYQVSGIGYRSLTIIEQIVWSEIDEENLPVLTEKLQTQGSLLTAQGQSAGLKVSGIGTGRLSALGFGYRVSRQGIGFRSLTIIEQIVWSEIDEENLPVLTEKLQAHGSGPKPRALSIRYRNRWAVSCQPWAMGFGYQLSQRDNNQKH